MPGNGTARSDKGARFSIKRAAARVFSPTSTEPSGAWGRGSSRGPPLVHRGQGRLGQRLNLGRGPTGPPPPQRRLHQGTDPEPAAREPHPHDRITPAHRPSHLRTSVACSVLANTSWVIVIFGEAC